MEDECERKTAGTDDAEAELMKMSNCHGGCFFGANAEKFCVMSDERDREGMKEFRLALKVIYDLVSAERFVFYYIFQVAWPPSLLLRKITTHLKKIPNLLKKKSLRSQRFILPPARDLWCGIHVIRFQPPTLPRNTKLHRGMTLCQ